MRNPLYVEHALYCPDDIVDAHVEVDFTPPDFTSHIYVTIEADIDVQVDEDEDESISAV
jgi:hypothetical protein